jgi:hypothetical protein
VLKGHVNNLKNQAMKLIEIVFFILIFLTINEYRLIKKYIQNLENIEPSTLKKAVLKTYKQLKKPINWLNNKLLTNDLNH